MLFKVDNFAEIALIIKENEARDAPTGQFLALDQDHSCRFSALSARIAPNAPDMGHVRVREFDLVDAVNRGGAAGEADGPILLLHRDLSRRCQQRLGQWFVTKANRIEKRHRRLLRRVGGNLGRSLISRPVDDRFEGRIGHCLPLG